MIYYKNVCKSASFFRCCCCRMWDKQVDNCSKGKAWLWWVLLCRRRIMVMNWLKNWKLVCKICYRFSKIGREMWLLLNRNRFSNMLVGEFTKRCNAWEIKKVSELTPSNSKILDGRYAIFHLRLCYSKWRFYGWC